MFYAVLTHEFFCTIELRSNSLHPPSTSSLQPSSTSRQSQITRSQIHRSQEKKIFYARTNHRSQRRRRGLPGAGSAAAAAHSGSRRSWQSDRPRDRPSCTTHAEHSSEKPRRSSGAGCQVERVPGASPPYPVTCAAGGAAPSRAASSEMQPAARCGRGPGPGRDGDWIASLGHSDGAGGIGACVPRRQQNGG